MPFCLTGATLAAFFQREARFILDDLKAIARAIVALFSSLQQESVLGVPVDRWLHLVVAAAIILIAARFMAKWKAAVMTVLFMALKEAVDVPAKLRFLREGGRIALTVDTAWDIVAGLVGLGAGFLFVAAMGYRWRARPCRQEGRALPPPEETELRPLVSGAAALVLVAASVSIVVGFQVGRAVTGRMNLLGLPHVIAAGLVVAGYVWLGPANTFLFIIPALPFANYVAPDKPNVGNTLILTLLCCEIVRRLKNRQRGLLLGWADWPVVVYSAYAVCIVVLNCFCLGWSADRAYWGIPPVTGLAVYLLAKNLLADARLLRRAMLAFAVVFLVIAAIGIVEFVVRPVKLEEVPGCLFGNAPAFGVYLSLVWPFALAVALSGRVRPRLLCWLGVALGVVAIVLVFNRSCWAAAGCAFALLVVLFAFHRDWALGLGVTAAMCAMAAVLVWGVRGARAAPPQAPFKSRLVREAASVLEPDIYRKARGSVVDVANRALKASPLRGTTGRSAHTLHHAHAINYGIPGTVLAAVAILGILAYGWLGVLRSRDPLVFAVVAGATASVAAAILEGMGWSTLRRSSIQPFFWYILGLVPAALYAARGSARPVPRKPDPPPRRAVSQSRARRAAQPDDTRRLLMLVIVIWSLAAAAVLLWRMF